MHNICRIISRRPRHVYRRRRLVSNLIDDSSTRLVGLGRRSRSFGGGVTTALLFWVVCIHYMLHIICQRPFRILGGGAWLLFCFINLLRTIRLIASIEMLVPRRLLIIRLEAMAFDSINNSFSWRVAYAHASGSFWLDLFCWGITSLAYIVK